MSEPNITGLSLKRISDLKPSDIEAIFKKAHHFKSNSYESRFKKSPVVAFLFFEPSTRTKLSFQMAAYRLGAQVLDFSLNTSSLSKGESFRESFLTVAAMKPDLFVVRHNGADQELNELLNSSKIPVINAGSGISDHPTQALLDAFTLRDKLGDLRDKKLLMVGDVKHSRVAHSNLSLLKALGVKVSICCPEFMKPTTEFWSGVQIFTDLEKAIKSADIVMGLRAQLERHGEQSFSKEEYRNLFQINPKSLSFLKSDGLFMHPGPHQELDLDQNILKDKRCLIREQVSNGVYIRAALISLVLSER